MSISSPDNDPQLDPFKESLRNAEIDARRRACDGGRYFPQDQIYFRSRDEGVLPMADEARNPLHDGTINVPTTARIE